MRSSNKSRSRNKNQNRRGNNSGNIINRVFDSSGPEGKVRGTPQQIIDKYIALAGDAQLSGDRIAHENFMQHAEHYSRILGASQREMAERKEQMDAQRANQQKEKVAAQAETPEPQDEQPDVTGAAADVFPMEEGDAGLVETPENELPRFVTEAPRKSRAKKKESDTAKSEAESDEQPNI